MADLPPPGQVTRPLCDKVCTIPAGGTDSLPNNLHALHIVELKKALTEGDRSLAERDSTIVGHENTITILNNTNAELNSTNSTLSNILKNGQ